MDLSLDIANITEKLLENQPSSGLKTATSLLIDNYKNNSGTGEEIIKDKLSAEIYACYRLPATYKATLQALKYVLEIKSTNYHTVIDVGAGSGAASIAVSSLLSPSSIICLERNSYMKEVGEYIFNELDIKNKPIYKDFDLVNDNLNDKGDLVLSSYLFNELNEKDIKSSLLKMWNKSKDTLLIIEPGTPRGFSIIKYIRDILVKEGGYIIAPCTHMHECPLSSTDWCHFIARVNRTKLHKMLKSGDAPYEDEKYCYIAFSKSPIEIASHRILRRPIINKGNVKVTLCNESGVIEKIFSKKDGQIYKNVRKSQAGDKI